MCIVEDFRKRDLKEAADVCGGRGSYGESMGMRVGVAPDWESEATEIRMGLAEASKRSKACEVAIRIRKKA